MKDGKVPNPDIIHPIAGYDKEIYVKPTVRNPNIIVGDFTYIADSDFESHVTHHYEWNGDKLIIGKFCQIAAGVEFVMNGANHQMNAVSIVAGNPAKPLRKRFDDELTDLLLRFKWWDRSTDEINELIPILTCGELDKVKEEIKKRVDRPNPA